MIDYEVIVRRLEASVDKMPEGPDKKAAIAKLAETKYLVELVETATERIEELC